MKKLLTTICLLGLMAEQQGLHPRGMPGLPPHTGPLPG